MKILITGASGMLGANLVKEWNKKYEVFATAGNNFLHNPAKNFKEFDLKAKNYQSLARWLVPDAIVHCAALTSHEYCQSHPEEAMVVNGESVKKLVKAFPKAKLIFVSTDAVFPLKTHLATEKTKTGPATVYGKSKELGEKHLLNLAKNGCVVRTTIVGKNINPSKQSFVEWFVSSLRKNKKITLYEDVIFTPITIWGFTKELEWIINNKTPKILHIAGSEIVSKYDFGYQLAKKLKLDMKVIDKGRLIDSKIKTIKRANDQSLDCSLYQKLSSRNLPDMKETINSLYSHLR